VISATLAYWLAVTRRRDRCLETPKRDGMVAIKSDGRIHLTSQGRRIAEQTILRHHLIERMLSEISIVRNGRAPSSKQGDSESRYKALVTASSGLLLSCATVARLVHLR
jgi:hypothetical protein